MYKRTTAAKGANPTKSSACVEHGHYELCGCCGASLFSLLYDYTNIHVTLYTAVAISGAAAVINSGLVGDARLGPASSRVTLLDQVEPAWTATRHDNRDEHDLVKIECLGMTNLKH